jgi:uncharacterized protein (TIGR02001 family)
MRNYCKTIGALAAASALAAGTASAQLEYEIHTGYTNEYLFRGLNLGQDLVEAGLDVATSYAGLDLSAGVWYGAFTSGGANETETDIYAEVAKDLGFATAAVGYIYYSYPQSSVGADAQEIYFSLSREFFGFDASLTHFWGIRGDNDGYTELALGKSIPLNNCLSLSTGLALGYYFEQSEFAHLTAKVALDYAFTETAVLSPFVAGSLSLSDAPAAPINAGAKNEFVGGVMLSVGF